MDASVNGHLKSANVCSLWVWFEGSTALSEGMAVVFDADYGTAADVDCRRNNRVKLPGAGSSKYDFAGVAARNYSAKSGGQFVEVYAPGSRGVIVQLADAQTTTIGSGVITFGDGGKFSTGTGAGCGFAVPRQTQATGGGKVQADLMVGHVVGMVPAANQADSEASDVAGVVSDLNDVLDALKAAGLMTADAEE